MLVKRKIEILTAIALMLLLADDLSAKAYMEIGRGGPQRNKVKVVDYRFITEGSSKFIEMVWSEPIAIEQVAIISISGQDLGTRIIQDKKSKKKRLDIRGLPHGPHMYSFTLKDGRVAHEVFREKKH